LHSFRAYFRFTIREILFAMIALGALLGLWLQRPVRRGETELCSTIVLRDELQSAADRQKIKVSIPGSNSWHRLGHFEEQCAIELPAGDIEDLLTTLRERIRQRMLDVKGIRLRGTSSGNDSFSYTYEVRDIQGHLSFYLFPAREPATWHALLIVHETRTRR
jgi:hypothetical protein